MQAQVLVRVLERKISNKRYECHIGECRKAFSQVTHLEIHIRAHTGRSHMYGPCTSYSSSLPRFFPSQPIHSHSQPTKTTDAKNSPDRPAPTPPARVPFLNTPISSLTSAGTLASALSPAIFAAGASAHAETCTHT